MEMEKEEKKKYEEEKKIREYEKNKKEKNEARRKEIKCNDVQEENTQKEGTSSPITKSEFDRVGKKAQEKTKMIEKVALSGKKHKDKEMTFGEHCKEFEKEIEELSTLKDEASEPKKKR
ncbi:protein MNN4-like [Cucumis melo var. makuwa]|uniref:Protein MNN4-like n=1 Tax=Cucumis melo var. makuwa TaxID=1194695 RepID=A0A5D3DER8_CUCMM|nr:protein MNN4-like [Cucumis melo var. makuwa]TYK22033.1 protein MNN4-like [Cucumis melo var. makuwa]